MNGRSKEQKQLTLRVHQKYYVLILATKYREKQKHINIIPQLNYAKFEFGSFLFR